MVPPRWNLLRRPLLPPDFFTVATARAPLRFRRMKTEHVNATRKLLGWTKRDLAGRARVDPRTISNIEAERHVPSPHTLNALRKAFESAGVDFNDGECPRLRSKQ